MSTFEETRAKVGHLPYARIVALAKLALKMGDTELASHLDKLALASREKQAGIRAAKDAEMLGLVPKSKSAK